MIDPEMLQQYGGWGIAAFALTCWINDRKKFGDLLEKRHNEYVEVIEKVTASLTSSTDLIRRVEPKLDKE